MLSYTMQDNMGMLESQQLLVIRVFKNIQMLLQADISELIHGES